AIRSIGAAEFSEGLEAQKCVRGAASIPTCGPIPRTRDSKQPTMSGVLLSQVICRYKYPPIPICSCLFRACDAPQSKCRSIPLRYWVVGLVILKVNLSNPENSLPVLSSK